MRPLLGAVLGLALLIGANSATAYQPGPPGQEQGFSLGGDKPVLGEGDRVPKMEAGFTKPDADGAAQLFIIATMPEGVHTYSITQPAGGPIRTKIKVDTSADVPSIGKFQTATKPHVKHDEEIYPGIALEEQPGKVKWFAPIKLAAGATPEKLKMDGKIYMQLCEEKGVCAIPKDYSFTATYRPDVEAEKEVAAPSKATGTNPPPPSGNAPSPSVNPPAPSTKSGNSASNLPAAGPPSTTANAAPLSLPDKSVAAAEATKPSKHSARKDFKWWRFTSVDDLHNLVGGFDVNLIRANVQHAETQLSVPQAILFGLLGGLILNIMPCVLPVIGLKIVSFVQQSGHHRGKAFALNLWYSAGLLTVFLVLASLAVGPQKLGWGQLFAETWFPIALSAVVFVMGLSFMGLWEVPLPSFAAGGKAGELAAQEGAVGAFFKGALTTLLATPCSAPFLAPALVWAAAQPPWLTYLVFASIGLGMASPYLLIGAFPELLRFLPKPGAWMETFKHTMGFVLMATVVYLLTVMEPYNIVPTVGLLFALWFGCWWVGSVSPLADIWHRLRAWALAISFCGAVWIVMFPGINSSSKQGFSLTGLSATMQHAMGYDDDEQDLDDASQLTGPKPVLVDFTASWCPNCHYFENTVLRTKEVADAVQKLNVATLKADWSHKVKNLEVTKMLDVLGSRQIPVIAIFSPADPNHPRVFRGNYTQKEILDALQWAAEPPHTEVAAAR